MQKLLTLVLAVGSLASFGAQATAITGTGAPVSNAALAGGTVIDFESATPGEYATLTIGNVSFVGIDDAFRISSDFGGNFNTSGTHLNNGPYDDTMAYSLRFNFGTAVSAFAFNWGAADAVWLLSAFDASNNLLDSLALTATGGSNSGEYFGLATAGISYATLVNQSGDAGDWVFIDNFTISANQVPEPATVFLMGFGLLGLGAMRRRLTRMDSPSPVTKSGCIRVVHF